MISPSVAHVCTRFRNAFKTGLQPSGECTCPPGFTGENAVGALPGSAGLTCTACPIGASAISLLRHHWPVDLAAVVDLRIELFLVAFCLLMSARSDTTGTWGPGSSLVRACNVSGLSFDSLMLPGHVVGVRLPLNDFVACPHLADCNPYGHDSPSCVCLSPTQACPVGKFTSRPGASR